MTRNYLIAAFAFPILALAALTGYKGSIVNFGKEVRLPITGYDPRDLLSGHYLIYQINYGVEDLCFGNEKETPGYVCLEPKFYSDVEPENCNTLVRGTCQYSRFTAGVERFYVPEERAKELEDRIRDGNAEIVLSITRDGHAQVKDLLIDGQSWRERQK